MLRIRWLIAVAALSFSPVIAMGANTSARLPVLTNDDAWKRLPGAPSTPQPLPMWARMYAGPMPLATSAMLELDAMHRTGDRLDPRARALIRWSAADANACEYSKAVAVRDFPELPKLLANPDRLEASERAAMAFARKMMLRAYAVTDEEFKAVHDAFGEEPTVAIVSMLAFASFHDRLILAMNAPLEAEGPLPPLMVKFERPKPKPHPMGADMIGKTGRVANASKGLANDDEWLRMTFRELAATPAGTPLPFEARAVVGVRRAHAARERPRPTNATPCSGSSFSNAPGWRPANSTPRPSPGPATVTRSPSRRGRR